MSFCHFWSWFWHWQLTGDIMIHSSGWTFYLKCQVFLKLLKFRMKERISVHCKRDIFSPKGVSVNRHIPKFHYLLSKGLRCVLTIRYSIVLHQHLLPQRSTFFKGYPCVVNKCQDTASSVWIFGNNSTSVLEYLVQTILQFVYVVWGRLFLANMSMTT